MVDLRSGAINSSWVLFSNWNSYTAGTSMNKQILETAVSPPIESDLFDPYEKLVHIEILGKSVQVPEKNRLLRCFQYLSINTISYGDFCWNGECTNCQIWFHMKGQSAENDKPALSCRQEVIEGMVITKLSQFIELKEIGK
jgi:hypothetical protein